MRTTGTQDAATHRLGHTGGRRVTIVATRRPIARTCSSRFTNTAWQVVSSAMAGSARPSFCACSARIVVVQSARTRTSGDLQSIRLVGSRHRVDRFLDIGDAL
ncbi:hypothetical protein ALI144C_02465 [Actinosynnema sp. ALI-1.44]|nr:hypothetical protein ALI144C_02465 [Actinosynnema sp. ALI-1.44]